LTPLHALIASVLELEAYLLTSNRVSVRVDIPFDLPALPLDRAQMQQVFLNLTLSALEGIRSRQAVDETSGGLIEIRASLSGTSDDAPSIVRVAVSDDGSGVPPEHLSQLLDPSATRDGGAQLDGGALRLPVSQAIIAAHGGQLRHEPSPTGVGETFIVELPLPAAARSAASDRPVPRTTRAASPSAASAASASAPPLDADRERARPPAAASGHVLVVDDEPSIRRFLTRALQIAGFEPVAAEDGASAIEIARETMFDAAVCDHRMAGLTGTDAYAALVELQPHLARRFVLMSGDVLNPALREFAETRGLALLAKPFDVETVGRTVRAVIARDEVQSRG
jgi:CheY-like chemotaxis protein